MNSSQTAKHDGSNTTSSASINNGTRYSDWLLPAMFHLLQAGHVPDHRAGVSPEKRRNFMGRFEEIHADSLIVRERLLLALNLTVKLIWYSTDVDSLLSMRHKEGPEADPMYTNT